MGYSIEDFADYKAYLRTISKHLDFCFENQKEYICCKKGCAHCCESGQYPYSSLEFNYLLLGFFQIERNEQLKVIQRIKNLKEEFFKTDDKKNFSYRCPFLSEDKVCTVYDFRGIICRTFGLLTELNDGSYTLPFCSSLGLNYSKVYNENTKKINYDAVEKNEYKKYIFCAFFFPVR